MEFTNCSVLIFYFPLKSRGIQTYSDQTIQPGHSPANSHAFHDSSFRTSHTVVSNTSRRQRLNLGMIPYQEVASQVMETAQEWVIGT